MHVCVRVWVSREWVGGCVRECARAWVSELVFRSNWTLGSGVFSMEVRRTLCEKKYFGD